MKHILKSWDKLKRKISGKYIMLFLDYDGTLTPIVDSPGKATMPKGTKQIVRALVNNPRFKLAVISGRALRDIKKLVGLKGIIYAGNHGFEIEGPSLKFKNLVSPRLKSTLRKIRVDLRKGLSSVKGAFVEDKGFTLSLHYRLAAKEDLSAVRNIFYNTIQPYLSKKKIKIKRGKKVFEVRPPLEWDKGKVVLWLLAKKQFNLRNNNKFSIYMGDDITDEDAFRVLENKALTIFVGTPKRKSLAQYYLKNTQEVAEFLKAILKQEKEARACRN